MKEKNKIAIILILFGLLLGTSYIPFNTSTPFLDSQYNKLKANGS